MMMESLRRSTWRSLLRSERKSRSKRVASQARPFTHNRQLRLSRIPQRTQLPYLHSRVQHGGQQFQIRFFRLFTIREPKTIREAGVTFIQVGIVLSVAYGLWKIAEWGISQETLERHQPTPHEYSWTTRVKLREALGEEESAINGYTAPNWKNTGDKFVATAQRLEDRNIDGKNTRGILGEDEDIYVDGVGRTGMDVSGCSEPWRRGYYQALMGAGRCAERLDGWVRDRTRGMLFPEKYVVGPSYPNPQPLPTEGSMAPPREEDCDAAFAQPQKYYLKVITTQGFSIGQRLRAALAYADWLRYKGLNEAAQGMHTWAVDIALEGVEGVREGLINRDTGVLDQNTTTLTPNLLLAVENFGSHFALTGNMAAALPVYLSILRTQQNLPSIHVPEPVSDDVVTNPYFDFIRRIILPPKYPPPPPSGNEIFTKTPDTICASTRTMTHVGEILFASDLAALSLDPNKSSDHRFQASLLKNSAQPSSTQSAGLSWTRQAADVAEETLKALKPEDESERYTIRSRSSATGSGPQKAQRKRIQEQQKHCVTCLTLALDNWVQMVERFERIEQEQSRGRQKSSKEPVSNEQHQHARDIRKMMTAAYRSDSTPDEVLAEVKQTATKIDNATEAALESRRATTPQASQSSSGKGWGMFWSSKLGLTPEPEESKVIVDGAKGPWEREAAKVRARRWEARLLRRQLGLED